MYVYENMIINKCYLKLDKQIFQKQYFGKPYEDADLGSKVPLNINIISSHLFSSGIKNQGSSIDYN